MVRLEEQHDPTTRSTSFCCCCLLVVFSLSGSFRLLSAKLAVRLPGFFCGKDPPPGWTPRCCCYLVLFGSEVTGGEWVFPPCYQDLNKKYNVILCYFMGSVYSTYTINGIQPSHIWLPCHSLEGIQMYTVLLLFLFPHPQSHWRNVLDDCI